MSEERTNVKLIKEIILAEKEQNEITGLVAAWVARNPRPKITMDQLVNMINIKPRLEAVADRWFTDNGVARRPFIFTVDGTYMGTRLLASTVGGDPILVLAPTENAARAMAAEGIEMTVKAAIDFFSQQLATPTEQEQGVFREAGGRKNVDADPYNLRPSKTFMMVQDALKSVH